ncbi:hypothetical protein Taro_004830 [Colocasia esculenta]|uniref:Aminotransferase-like plant mobile domain-containing protein n=1 Tax=Colocasia esculenta TaxID=4460 RepID=A0A843TQP1_COLES|nr:hypothetical protein [Colocasia esculenta]
MGFGPVLEIEPFFIDPPLIQALRDRWDRTSRAFLLPWGHMVPCLEDVARITGLRVDGEAVSGITYADYTEHAQDLLGLDPQGDEDGDRRMVGRVALLEALGLAGVRQRAKETLQEYVQRAAGLARAAYGHDPKDTERVDRDLRRFLTFFFGKMLFTTKGDDIHCRFLEPIEDLDRVGEYAWGAALLAHTFADLSAGTGRETTVGGFAPFLQVWSYYYLPLGRATQVHPDAVPLARRWLPVVSTATYGFQLDILRQAIRDFPPLLVVWEPYVGVGDEGQPWVESGRPRFGRDLWVHYLNEIEPLSLRLAARTLGLYQVWLEVEEPRGIGRKTRGKPKMVDWHLRFPDQHADWQQGSHLVESDAADSLAYLERFQEEYGGRDYMRPARDAWNDLIDTLRAQLADTKAQLAEERLTLETLRTSRTSSVTPRPPWAPGPVLWVAVGRLSRRGSDRIGVWFCFILRQGVCRLLECDIPYVAFWFDGLRQGWNCDRGYVAFLKATHPLSPSGSQCDTRCVAFSGSGLNARAPELFSLSRVFPFPLSPSRPLGVPTVLGVPPPC